MGYGREMSRQVTLWTPIRYPRTPTPAGVWPDTVVGFPSHRWGRGRAQVPSKIKAAGALGHCRARSLHLGH